MTNQPDGKDQRLIVEVVDKKIVISIGVETLKYCHNRLEKEADPGFGTGFAITNALGFAEDVADALNLEEDDGSTKVHEILDWAVQLAHDNGSTHTKETSK